MRPRVTSVFHVGKVSRGVKVCLYIFVLDLISPEILVGHLVLRERVDTRVRARVGRGLDRRVLATCEEADKYQKETNPVHSLLLQITNYNITEFL